MLEEGEGDADERHGQGEQRDEPALHAGLVGLGGGRDEVHRTAVRGLTTEHAVAGAEGAGFARNAHEHGARGFGLVGEERTVVGANAFFVIVGFERLPVGGGGFEHGGRELFVAGGLADFAVTLEEHDAGAGFLGELLREAIVDLDEADDGAERRLREVVFDGARADAVHVAGDQPGVVPEEASERIEHGGIPTELEVGRGLGLAEADVAEHPTVAVDHERGVETDVFREALVDASEGFFGLDLGAGEAVFLGRGLQRLANAVVRAGHQERVEVTARVELERPAGHLRVGLELLFHGLFEGAVELTNGQRHRVERERRCDGADDVPDAGEHHHGVRSPLRPGSPSGRTCRVPWR